MANVEVIGLKELQRDLAKLGQRAPQVLGRELFREAQVIVRKAKEETPADMGTLRASIRAELPKRTTTGVEVTIGAGGSAASYALYIHEGIGPAVGRPPFFPPLDAVRGWLLRHGMDEKLAFVVARAIGRRGLPPTKFLEKPFRAQVRGMGRRLATRIREEARRVAR